MPSLARRVGAPSGETHVGPGPSSCSRWIHRPAFEHASGSRRACPARRRSRLMSITRRQASSLNLPRRAADRDPDVVEHHVQAAPSARRRRRRAPGTSSMLVTSVRTKPPVATCLAGSPRRTRALPPRRRRRPRPSRPRRPVPSRTLGRCRAHRPSRPAISRRARAIAPPIRPGTVVRASRRTRGSPSVASAVRRSRARASCSSVSPSSSSASARDLDETEQFGRSRAAPPSVIVRFAISTCFRATSSAWLPTTSDTRPRRRRLPPPTRPLRREQDVRGDERPDGARGAAASRRRP